MGTKSSYDKRQKIQLLVTIMTVFLGISSVFSQTTNVYRIQSLFLYNFTKHITWEDTNATFTIGVFGNSKAFDVIKSSLSHKEVWEKSLNVVEISSRDELTDCHIAYFPKSNKQKILDFIDGGDGANALLVTEDDLMSNGVAISFIFERSTMKFKISKEKIEQVGLKVDSSLISIGIPV